MTRKKKVLNPVHSKLSEFGILLRTLRIQKDLTQGALGDALGVSAPLVSCMESGYRSVPIKFLEKLMAKFPEEAPRIDVWAKAVANQTSVLVIPLPTPDRPSHRALALEFHRKFESLTHDQINQMLKILEAP